MNEGLFFEQCVRVVDTNGNKNLTAKELEKLWIKQGKKYANTTRISQLIEQAKMEFPKIKPIEVNTYDVRNIDIKNLSSDALDDYYVKLFKYQKQYQQQVETNTVEYINEVNKWYKKWFGV